MFIQTRKKLGVRKAQEYDPDTLDDEDANGYTDDITSLRALQCWWRASPSKHSHRERERPGIVDALA